MNRHPDSERCEQEGGDLSACNTHAQAGVSPGNGIKGVLGYIWAVLALCVVLVTFFGNNSLSAKFASLTGLKVSPWYTGGEVVKTIDYGSYRTLQHRPVFDGLIGEREEGFVQVNWEASNGLPPSIQEKIDYNGDGKDDFLISLDTIKGVFSLTAYNPSVLSIQETYKLKKGWAVRVQLKKGK